ncbi:MAG: hypothetical protein A2W77_07250 [Nitrospinae bacterium RIFCSPLOWO2_12_39_16]|nr:MAG: hypothetical protein A2W77_07250 [Nitrospinae bacterium RIFCSPLOWO2_12_39_16]
MKQINELSEKIIGCAIEVHKNLGPGLLEENYEKALCRELELSGLRYQRQVKVPMVYKGTEIGEYRVDLIVEDKVVLENKSVERYDPIFEAQVLTYLKITNKRVGLLMNFNSRFMKDGIKRFIL